MRIRTFLVAATLVVVAGASTACGSGPDEGSSKGGSNTTAAAPETPKGQGEPIDVKAELLKQGFKETQVAAIAKDSAYWLMPFGSPFVMSQNPGEPTCMFRIVRDDFRTNPAKKAYVDYPIKSDSAVKIRTKFLNPDGSDRAVHDTDITMPFKDVTPQALATNKDLPLSQCGNTKLS